MDTLTASDLRHQIAMSNLRYMPGEASWISTSSPARIVRCG